jgi:4'-phosphopantetheinyl transferase
MLLGRYLRLEPSDVAFVYGLQGKPALAVPQPDFPLSFNLSHSEDVVAYAFALNRRIGVDIERVRSLPDAGAFATQFFSPSEREVLAGLHGDRKARAFFAIWTGKEALLKAIGSGLTRPMNQTVISLDKEGSVEVGSVDGGSAEAANWRLHSFAPAPGFRGSLAVEGRDWKLIYHPLRDGLE